MTNQNNFDWSYTNREFVLYVPNFKRKYLLIPTLKRFNTSIDKNRWLILVVNDGPHEDMSDLEEQFNLKYLTFERQPENERNGCMIRNYIIKNCQSKWLATKDPEIIINHDIIAKTIFLDDVIYRPGGMIELQEQETQKIINDPFIDLTKLSILREWKVTPNNYQGFHNGVVIRTEKLKEMQGYEEDFCSGYGWEDVNLLERLKKMNTSIVIDDKIVTYHIHHPIIRKFHKTIDVNGRVYEHLKIKNRVIANENKEWGKGI